MTSEEISDLLKEQGQRLFDMVDCGYAEAFAKVMNGYDLEAKDVAIIENFKGETKRFMILVDKLEKLGKAKTS